MYQASYTFSDTQHPSKPWQVLFCELPSVMLTVFANWLSMPSLDLFPDGCHTKAVFYSLQTLLKVLGRPVRFTYWGHNVNCNLECWFMRREENCSIKNVK